MLETGVRYAGYKGEQKGSRCDGRAGHGRLELSYIKQFTLQMFYVRSHVDDLYNPVR